MKFPLTVLGFDIGLVCTAWAELIVAGGSKQLRSTGNVKTPSSWNTERRIEYVRQNAKEIIRQLSPGVIGVETHIYFASGQPSNVKKFDAVCRLSGNVEGIAYAHGTTYAFNKYECNKSVGLKGKASDSDIKTAIARLFPKRRGNVVPKNAHERDAVLVALRAYQEEELGEKIAEALRRSGGRARPGPSVSLEL